MFAADKSGCGSRWAIVSRTMAVLVFSLFQCGCEDTLLPDQQPAGSETAVEQDFATSQAGGQEDGPHGNAARQDVEGDSGMPQRQEDPVVDASLDGQQGNGDGALKPVFDLPQPEGWEFSGARELQGADGDFSVAYEHPTGVTLTLFQYTNDLVSIPEDLDSPELKSEMREARAQIQRMTALGMWLMSEEMDSGLTTLGDSSRNVVFSKYKIRTENRRAHSYIYLWAQDDHFLKIRMTCSPYRTQEEKLAISELLTALGNATTAPTVTSNR
ncbi:MAG: hypothetical protein AAF456_17075 [Planctomycetota bacterium]